jgi:hypothetical protein
MSVSPPEENRSSTAVEAELKRLRERVSFYESFDGLINDNIARAGHLLREAAEVRESAQRSVAEAERQSEIVRASYRELLSSLLGETEQLRAQADALAGRVAYALDQLGTAPPGSDATAAVETPPSPVEEPPAPDPEPEAAQAPIAPIQETGAPTATILLVHGVPNAMTALSLKRFLEELTFIERVDPREFAEGILRIEVTGNRPLTLDDITAWSSELALEPVHLRADLVEVRLVS